MRSSRSLSVLQTLPFFTYLLPAVIFFKVGPTAGAVATTIYAIPPMILMTTLGLQKVSPEVVEAGKMSGLRQVGRCCARSIMPSARTEILVGVNQVIMLCLAMVVLTAFIGMPGLGAKLLAMMNSFKLGRSLEIGITIVLVAVMLDRMSKAWVSNNLSISSAEHPGGQPHSRLRCWLLSVSWFSSRWHRYSTSLHEVGRRQAFIRARNRFLIKWFLDLDVVQGDHGGHRAMC